MLSANLAVETLLPLLLLTTASLAQHSVARLETPTGFPPCDALLCTNLTSRVLVPSSPTYSTRIKSYFSLNAQHHPWCLFLPSTAHELSTGLRALSAAGPGAGDWHIAVRSGGHGNPGSNNVAHGVTIDLGAMNASWYDAATGLAHLQPGARWRDVYADLLATHNVSVTGGRDGDVGVGGFLLGGGISYHTGVNGFGCDTVRGFEVVLADGRVVHANATSHAELFKALKGGGGNFGVVTRFDVEAMPAGEIAYGQSVVAVEHSDAVVEDVVRFTRDAEERPWDHLITMYTFTPGADESRILSIRVNARGDMDTTAFAGVQGIPSLTSSWERMSLAAAANASQLASGYRTSSATLTLLPSPSLLKHAATLHTTLTTTLTALLGPKTFLSSMILQPMPKSYAAISKRKGGNVMGMQNIGGNAIMWTGGIGVTGDDDAFAMAEAEFLKMVAELRERAKGEGALARWVYMNYAHAGQDVLGSYGGENLEFLRSVAGRYDPGGFWQVRVPGGFKVSRAG